MQGDQEGDIVLKVYIVEYRRTHTCAGRSGGGHCVKGIHRSTYTVGHLLIAIQKY